MDLPKMAYQAFRRLIIVLLGGAVITAIYWSVLGGLGIFSATFLWIYCTVQLFGAYMNFHLRNVHPKGKIVGNRLFVNTVGNFATPFVFYSAGKHFNELGYFQTGIGFIQMKYWAMVILPFLYGFMKGGVRKIKARIYEKKLVQRVEERSLGPSTGSRLEFNAALGELARGENLEEATQLVINFGCGITGSMDTTEVSGSIPPDVEETTNESVVGETGHGQVGVEMEVRKEFKDQFEKGKRIERVGKYKISRTRNVIEFYHYFGSGQTTAGILDPAKAVDRYQVVFDPETFKLLCFGKIEYTDLFCLWPTRIRNRKVQRTLGSYDPAGELAFAMILDMD